MDCSPIYATRPSSSPTFPAKIADRSAKLDVTQAFNLYDALETLEKVIYGLSQRPAFAQAPDSEEFNAAGIELDDLRASLCRRMAGLVDEIAAADPDDNEWLRSSFLVRYHVEDNPSLLRLAKAAIQAKRPGLI